MIKTMGICFSALVTLMSLYGLVECLKKIRTLKIKILPVVLFFMIASIAFLYWGITMIFGG